MLNCMLMALCAENRLLESAMNAITEEFALKKTVTEKQTAARI